MTQISINYAIVLYQLGVSKEDIRYSKELFEAADALYESLASPVVTLHEKYVVIDRLFPESMRAFFKVLCRNQSKCEATANSVAGRATCFGCWNSNVFYTKERK